MKYLTENPENISIFARASSIRVFFFYDERSTKPPSTSAAGHPGADQAKLNELTFVRLEFTLNTTFRVFHFIHRPLILLLTLAFLSSVPCMRSRRRVLALG
jgi:hypothetical protein